MIVTLFFWAFGIFWRECLFPPSFPKSPVLLDATVQECRVTKAHAPKRSETSIT